MIALRTSTFAVFAERGSRNVIGCDFAYMVSPRRPRPPFHEAVQELPVREVPHCPQAEEGPEVTDRRIHHSVLLHAASSACLARPLPAYYPVGPFSPAACGPGGNVSSVPGRPPRNDVRPGTDGSPTRCRHPAIQGRDRDSEILGHLPGCHPTVQELASRIHFPWGYPPLAATDSTPPSTPAPLPSVTPEPTTVPDATDAAPATASTN